MTTLNRDGAAAAREAGAHALTDVTGFGLLGHLHEMTLASGLGAELDAAAVPAIDGVLELLSDPDERSVAGGTRRNRAHAEQFTEFSQDVPEARRWLVCDAMTSGGLLAAVPADRASAIPGFGPIAGARHFDELGAHAQAYVRRLEELLGAPISIVGTGQGREETIVREDPQAQNLVAVS